MTDLRYPDTAATPRPSETSATRIPRQRIGTTDDERLRLERAATTVEQWLDTQLADEDDEDTFDSNADHLLRVSRLAIEGVPEAELAAAVRRAREAGWSFAPIAVLLCATPAQVQDRFAAST